MRLTYTSRRRPRWGASLLVLGLLVGVAGCDSLLQVKDPTSISGEDILKISAANGMVNGALSGVARGYGNILAAYTTATDEMQWTGSRDDYRNLDLGNTGDPFNEFTDAQFTSLAQGRWMADEAIRILEIHTASTEADSQLTDPVNLGYAYLYSAIARVIIADMYDDYVFSNRQEAGMPFGERFGGNAMSTLYTDAITRLTTAMSIAQTFGDAGLEMAALAMRARAHHAMAIWGKVGRRPIDTSNNGLVTTANGVADARAVLAAAVPDYRYGFQYSSNTISAGIAGWVNSRQEMRMAPTFATPDPNGPAFLAVSLTDLIDVNTVSPELFRLIDDFTNNSNTTYPFLTVVSAREMHLIIAEDALASGNVAGFTTAINNLRALDAGLTPFVNGGAGMPTAADLLVHSRATNLFLMGRRLQDLYRFGLRSAEWDNTSDAVVAPGTFFPISITECRANENLPDAC